jgi:hypothetical protein
MEKIELKIKAFDYILFKLVEWYFESNNVRSWAYFNDEHGYRFDKDKLMSMLFPVCIGSRDRNTIFSIFDAFICTKEGIIEKDISENPADDYSRLDLSATFRFSDIDKCTFLFGGRIVYPPKEKKIINVPYKLIDGAIEHLRKNNEYFVNHDGETLHAYNRGHLSWILYPGKQIPYESLLQEKSTFSADPKLLVLV